MDEPQMLLVTADTMEAYWREFRKIGPRHENAYRWTVVLGWTFSNNCLRDYLEPEVQKAEH